MAEYDYTFKVVLIGDSGVGKSSILLKYVEDRFEPSFPYTIGIDFKIKNIIVGEKRVRVAVWDTAGQERFRTISTAHYRGAQAVIFVYDITNPESYNNIINWHLTLTKNIKDYHNLSMILVGNKTDLDESRKVRYSEGRRMADTYDMSFIETSAKDGSDISSIFDIVVGECIGKVAHLQGELCEEHTTIAIEDPPQEEKKCC